MNAGRTDQAIRLLTQTTRTYPDADLGWEQLGHAYLLQGKNAEALAALRVAAGLSGVRARVRVGETNNRVEAE